MESDKRVTFYIMVNSWYPIVINKIHFNFQQEILEKQHPPLRCLFPSCKFIGKTPKAVALHFGGLQHQIFPKLLVSHESKFEANLG